MSARTVTHATAPTSTTTVYVHDLNDHIIAELNASGQTQREYIWLDDMPVAVVDNVASGPGNEVVYFVHVDHLMRPARMTARNTSWVWDVIYAPFGGVSYIWSNPANIDLRFPGQWFQLESGLAYNWHRHYDATLGRYVQPDPIGVAGGKNLHAYASGNPISLTDPMGLYDLKEFATDANNFVVGTVDSMTFGLTRGLDVGTFDPCSKAYQFGEYLPLGLGGMRLAYASSVRLASVLATSGEAAATFRNGAKVLFRGGFFQNYRTYSYQDLLARYGSDDAVRTAAGRTDTFLNLLGAAGAAGAGLNSNNACGCPK